MEIRNAVGVDLSAIVEIYNASIPSRMATADLEAVSVASRQDWFDRHSPHSRPIWVAEREGEVVAWLSFQSFYPRPAYHKTVEVSLYVSPPCRRQGIGRQLLRHAIGQCGGLEVQTLIGFIFAHNYPSLQLFARHQFQRWGYLPQVAELDGVERDLAIVGRRIGPDR